MIRRGRESGKLTVETLLRFGPEAGAHARLSEGAVTAFDKRLTTGVAAEAA